MKKNYEVMDGNTAAAYVSYAFTEVAAIFPITPSSPMAEYVDEWAAKGKKNIFDETVEVVEMQSEGGAAGTMHGSLAAGALTTTYTASQGLLLMIPNIYKVAGELLPGVFHVSARALSVHALSIFGDHSDVMACRQIGTAMLASSNPQEVMDLGAVAHLAAIKGSVPFIHFFDGFRTSHEIQKIETWDYDVLKSMIDMDAVDTFRKKALNPERPTTRGCTENPDIYFQRREAANQYYDKLPQIVECYMKQVSEATGRNYQLFNYYGAKDAEYVIIAMGSVCDTICETVDYLNGKGEKVGLINVHLYRPFSIRHFLEQLPPSVKRIAVLDRTKEPGAGGEPLYLDICNALYQAQIEMEVYGGRYGLASKDTTPAQIMAVYEMLKTAPRHNFTIGIVDDVTHLSLEVDETKQLSSTDTINCKFWGLGSDGTVGANKNSVKIIGNHTEQFCQAYFVYDSKKSGGLTQSHLRFGKRPIRSPYLVTDADFIACSAPSYLNNYDLLDGMKQGGTFLLNCGWNEKELAEHLPAAMKRILAKKQVQFYVIDATRLAKEIGMAGRTNSILQGAFFKLVPVLPLEDAVQYMKEAVKKTYAKKGVDVIEKNYKAIELGVSSLIRVEVPEAWKDAQDDTTASALPEFVKELVVPMNRQQGEKLPVSKFIGLENGTFPNGTSAYEKRGQATDVPEWDLEKCIQCNRCAYVCPHAAIRPYLLDKSEQQVRPTGFETKKAIGKNLSEYEFRIQVSPLDCTGCGSCVNVCPVKDKALEMKPLESQLAQKENWTYAVKEVSDKSAITGKNNVKNSQFAQPLFEFSGACAGCAETPYIKLVTQLFGDRMYVANASGCSSAYGGSTPSTPYTKNKCGHGTAWAMSLFEDNAEYAYGLMLGAEKVRAALTGKVKDLAEQGIAKNEAEAWLADCNDSEKTRSVTDALVAALEKPEYSSISEVQDILKDREYLVKKSYWAFGGDGWAYDIGYGGLDHVIASNKNINILVLDTEVYSNTGGQSSKSTPASAIAKFAAAGKRTKKKDLGRMAMSYGYVYVAQVAMGYDPEQTLRAIREAEKYDGPSIIIAYCPCIEHGIREGMSKSQTHMKKAVEAGYWHLYRYNPERKKEGKNPFTLDSKEPTGNLREFLLGENRYRALSLVSPDHAEQMYQITEEDAKERYEIYKHLAE